MAREAPPLRGALALRNGRFEVVADLDDDAHGGGKERAVVWLLELGSVQRLAQASEVAVW